MSAVVKPIETTSLDFNRITYFHTPIIEQFCQLPQGSSQHDSNRTVGFAELVGDFFGWQILHLTHANGDLLFL